MKTEHIWFVLLVGAAYLVVGALVSYGGGRVRAEHMLAVLFVSVALLAIGEAKDEAEAIRLRLGSLLRRMRCRRMK